MNVIIRNNKISPTKARNGLSQECGENASAKVIRMGIVLFFITKIISKKWTFLNVDQINELIRVKTKRSFKRIILINMMIFKM